MRSFVQVLTTPTADTPGTTLLLHFDNKRYLIGSLAEGTQRACVQMGARLLKVSEYFLTGRAEWKNTGGLIGMILTLADSSAASQASSLEDALRKARSKGKRLGIADDEEKMRQLEEEAKRGASNEFSVFGPPNLNHTLATARRYVFRKGMPVNINEIRGDNAAKQAAANDDWAPFWADENIKVWAMPILPSTSEELPNIRTPTSTNPRKRCIDEVYATENGTVIAGELTPEERNYLTVKAVVSEMFNSSWRLDTLYETPLSDVKLPATIFVRNPDSNKIQKYTGPLPGGSQPVPDPNMKVLVRRPWPGALVESLPHTKPAREAVSYIIRNHLQRGKFHPELAKKFNVKQGHGWADLARGESVINQDGETVTPDMVLDPSRVGGGIAVVDLPDVKYIDNLISRAEWREMKVMEGVGAIVWICGKSVATDPRLHAFMQEFQHLEHIVSSPDYCPNNVALDSAAAATVRLKQVDPDRYGVPVHDAESPDGMQAYGGSAHFQEIRRKHPLPEGAHIAARGQVVQLEPTIEFQTKDTIPTLQIGASAAEVPHEVMDYAVKAQEASRAPDAEMRKWVEKLPPGAKDVEIITLGTGSALPSKYRNVSATLVRVPGWGNVLLDCGENTLGQLKRVFDAEELRNVLRALKILSISHMHADHQLGTTGVIKAWYEEVHGCQPASAPVSPSNGAPDFEEVFKNNDRLAVISEPAMQSWLHEYSAVEDYGYSRIAPLSISPADPAKGFTSRLNWYIPSPELKNLSKSAYDARIQHSVVPHSLLHLRDIQAVLVRHCHGARAVSITLPSGFKVSYSGDCRPSRAFAQIGKGSTVCIHEATFDDELQGDAEAKNHCTTSEALDVAQRMAAQACVLTHFSQRYQKVPVLERAGNDNEPEEEEAIDNETMAEAEEEASDPEDAGLDGGGGGNGAAITFPDQDVSAAAEGRQYEIPSKKLLVRQEQQQQQSQGGGAPEAVKLKLRSDMKVCVAFDYMRVKVGDIGQLEKFTPALLKLFAEEEKAGEEEQQQGGGSANGAKQEKKNKKNKPTAKNKQKEG